MSEEKIDLETIIYSINFEDVQNVAQQELSRQLTAEELKLVEEKIGDYFGWYEAILDCINDHVGSKVHSD